MREAERALEGNADFRDWFHRKFKAGEGIAAGSQHNPDMGPDEVLEAYQEWLSLGKPGRGG